jgi:L-lactate dehydrogenase (cytochrome)
VLSTTALPRRLRNVLSLEDLEPAAHAYLPRPIFGYVSGGVENNVTLLANRRQFDRWVMVPGALVDVSVRQQRTELFGESCEHPFGIAPMGISSLIAYQGDRSLARAAESAGIPMIVSGTGVVPLEEVRQHAPTRSWFQAYLPGDDTAITAMVERVGKAGYKTLVVTVDCNMLGNRENLTRVGFSTPLRPGPRLFLDGALRPAWSIGALGRSLLDRGMLHFENSSAERGVAVFSRNAHRSFSARERLNWHHIGLIRKLWPGALVLKGILSPADAAMAARHGVDGIVISNHGGRQLDSTVAPLDILPEILQVRGTMKVLIDSGFRRGTDVLKALALGADFVLIGRPFIYAAALGAEAGVARAIQILAAEIDRNLGMLGMTSLRELSPGCLRPSYRSV